MDGKSTGLRPHPGTRRLIAYRQGTLPAAERDGVQEHLSLCPRCAGLLRELRDFEAAVESGAPAPGSAPEPLREEAWASLVQRLPAKPPAIRPVAPVPRPRARFARNSIAATAAIVGIAALLIAVAGLGLLLRTDRQRLADLERQLASREESISGLQHALADAVRRLDAERGRLRSLETEKTGQIAELSSELERLRRNPSAPPRDRLAAADIQVALAPRFVLRGAESPGGDVLRGGGATNRVQSQDGSFTVGLGPPGDSPLFPEIRLELSDRNGDVVWSGRRPGEALGDDGASVTIQGLRPGRYRLRVEGVQPNRTRFLGEYALDVRE